MNKPSLFNSIRFLPRSQWPERLLIIPDPPERLYIEGLEPEWNRKFLVVVGSRKYSHYGKEVTEMLIEGLRGLAVTIVSGLALGIDAIAHRAALKAELPTIAIPGSGLDPHFLYPASHRRLAREIVAEKGCLISEFDPETPGYPSNFPRRNRIMAGLAHAVLVIEASERSGTLITSRLATEYNRDVCAVPGSIFSKQSAGPHMLIRLGAVPVTSPDDLREALGFERSGSENQSAEEKYKNCTKEEKNILTLLTSPLSRDELIRQAKLPIAETSSLLMALEIKGLIKESIGEIHLT